MWDISKLKPYDTTTAALGAGLVTASLHGIAHHAAEDAKDFVT
jgi:hypothetical protein